MSERLDRKYRRWLRVFADAWRFIGGPKTRYRCTECGVVYGAKTGSLEKTTCGDCFKFLIASQHQNVRRQFVERCEATGKEPRWENAGVEDIEHTLALARHHLGDEFGLVKLK